MLAEVAESRHSDGAISWIALQCATAHSTYYFNAALLISAILLAGPFIMWLNLSHDGTYPRPSPWHLRLPYKSIKKTHGQPLQGNPKALLHVSTGFFLSSSLVLFTLWLLLISDYFTLRPSIDWKQPTLEAIASAIFPALIEVLIFAGIIFGIFLRSFKLSRAILAVAILFAMIHTLLPTTDIKVINPSSLSAGFRILGAIGERFLQPKIFIPPFATFYVIGAILCYARYRTRSLWLSTGLYTGWIFSYLLFRNIAEVNSNHYFQVYSYMGFDGKSGFLPLSILVITGILTHFFTQLSSRKPQRTPSSIKDCEPTS